MAAERWSLVEYSAPTALLKEITSETGLGQEHISKLLQVAGERVAYALSFSQSPLRVSGIHVRAIDFAGLLRIGPSIELEVAPKFLGDGAMGWREDFYFLAMLSRHGRLMSSERLRALAEPNSDLASLVARALVQMFWDQHRRPIRTYRRRVVCDFAIDGDADPEDLSFPNEDGFVQTVIQYDRTNEFNSTIKAAASELWELVRDTEVRESLRRVMSYLGAQEPVRRSQRQQLPRRSRTWQATYELAIDVLKGFGLTYESGLALAPGFVVRTWRVWEDLVTISLRARLGTEAVSAQKGHRLGNRQRQTEIGLGKIQPFMVRPDIRIDGNKAGLGDMLVDAKYIGRHEEGRQRISEADVYESIAFSRAARVERVVLVYPKIAASSSEPTGNAHIFEKVDIGDCQIWGIEVEVRGIARTGGVKAFSDGLINQLRAIAPPP